MLVDISKASFLITGGAGFMGSCLIRILLKDSSFQGTITNLDLLTYCGNLLNLESVEKDPRYFFVQGDIGDQELIRQIVIEKKIDAIIHFAAETHVDRSILDPLAFVKTNVFGTYALLEIVKEFPSIHFHHVSTDEVYGSLGDHGLFDENSPYLPNSPYSASKASSDHFVRAFHKTYDLSTTISHAGNNYGPYQYPEKLIPFMITKLLKQEPLTLYGDGLHIRDWLFVEDHARAILAILQYGKKGEIYNIASEEEKTNLSLVNMLIDSFCDITGFDHKKCLIKFIKDRAGHDYRYAMKASKLSKETGWSPQTRLENGLRETLLWYLSSSRWIDSIERKKQRELCTALKK